MRKRSPIETRDKLITAATTLIVQNGAANLTMDAVVIAAGSSKGGLLHHFPTKESLLCGILQYHTTLFNELIKHELEAEPIGKAGRFTRAYIRATFNPAANEKEIGQALIGIVTAHPELLSELTTEFQDDGLPFPRATAIRLACDGYWISEVSGAPKINETLRAQLVTELLELTR
jgi:AcrR family transcriptional regulator